MAAEFDAYYKWLAIPPSQQPPTHYRLLGVPEFEPDADVIASAADRQMAHVRSYAVGPYAEHSQKLLNELAKARVCLLNPERRAAYDRQLSERQLSVSSGPADKPEASGAGPPKVTPAQRSTLQVPAERAASAGAARSPAEEHRPEHSAEPPGKRWSEPGEIARTMQRFPPISRADHETPPVGASGAPAGKVEAPGRVDFSELPDLSSHDVFGMAAPDAPSPSSVSSRVAPAAGERLEVEGALEPPGAQPSGALRWLKSPQTQARALAGWTAAVLLMHLGLGSLWMGIALAAVGGLIVAAGFRPDLLPRRSEAGRAIEMWGSLAITLAVLVAAGVPLACYGANLVGIMPAAYETPTAIDRLASAALFGSAAVAVLVILKIVADLSKNYGFFRPAAAAFAMVSLVLSVSMQTVSDLSSWAQAELVEFMSPEAGPRAVTSNGPKERNDDESNGTKPTTPPRGGRQSIAWNVGDDGQAALEAPLAAEHLELAGVANEIQRVVFARGAAPQAIVMNHGQSRGGAREAWIDRFDLTNNAHLQRLDLDGLPQLVDASADGQRVLLAMRRRVEIYSLADEKSEAAWQFSDSSVLAWGALLEDGAVATLDDRRRLIAWSPQQVKRYELTGVLCAALSPGKAYLATFERRGSSLLARISEAATGRLCGQLADVDSLRGFSPGRIAFHPDGTQLAAAGGGSVCLWDLAQGTLLAQHSVREGDYLGFVAGRGLLANGVLLDPSEERSLLELGFDSGDNGWTRVPASIDGRVWVVAAYSPTSPALLAPLDLPPSSEHPLVVERLLFGEPE